MLKQRISCRGLFIGAIAAVCLAVVTYGASDTLKENVYEVEQLKPIDSVPKLKVGDKAPDFTLPAVAGGKVSLSQYRGKKNVVISFVPAAWTPVCSEQWPGYNIAKTIFDQYDAQLIGITVDNIPTLYAWTNQMGRLWFPALSDFWPHGAVADKYGILRSDGTSERALFVIDKKGVVRYIDIHDINKRPPLDDLVKELEKFKKIKREEAAMEKIANLKDIKKGGSLTFTYKGEKAILIRTKKNDLVAYVAVCPHEAGDILWDERLEMVVCECHLSLFNVEDGSVYKHSSLFELKKGLTKIDLSVDKKKDIFAV